MIVVIPIFSSLLQSGALQFYSLKLFGDVSRILFVLIPASAMDSDGRIKAYEFVAYSAVSFSIVSILSVVISLPMVYNYVAHVRRQMQHEINFCKVIFLQYLGVN